MRKGNVRRDRGAENLACLPSRQLVALPVPFSLVMVAHGALFGVAVGTTLLSVVGSTVAALVGFALGRRGGPLLTRLVPPEERVRADRLLTRWGTLAIIVTRPVPLLAETTASWRAPLASDAEAWPRPRSRAP